MNLGDWKFAGDLDVAEGELRDKSAVTDQLRWLLACLRAQYWTYQHAHWETRGPTYYGNHLLFQRLYESVVQQTDTLAEKIVGTYGPCAVDSMNIASKFLMWINRWQDADGWHRRALLSEQDFQKACETTYELMKSMGELTLGMDDFLMATANEHETNQYLLRQVLRAGPEWQQMMEG